MYWDAVLGLFEDYLLITFWRFVLALHNNWQDITLQDFLAHNCTFPWTSYDSCITAMKPNPKTARSLQFHRASPSMLHSGGMTHGPSDVVSASPWMTTHRKESLEAHYFLCYMHMYPFSAHSSLFDTVWQETHYIFYTLFIGCCCTACNIVVQMLLLHCNSDVVTYSTCPLQRFLTLCTACLPTVHHARGRVRQVNTEL